MKFFNFLKLQLLLLQKMVLTAASGQCALSDQSVCVCVSVCVGIGSGSNTGGYSGIHSLLLSVTEA